MKRRAFPKLSAILLLLSLCFVLPSCAADYETLYEITKGDLTYVLEGIGSTPKRIALVNDGYVIRRIDIDVDDSVQNEDSRYGFYVEDANFDGKNDLIIATEKEGDICTYDVYLAANEKTDFSYSKQLSSLKNLRVRAEYQAVFGFDRTQEFESDGHYTLCDKATKYTWKNGTLIPDIYASLTYYSEQNLYCYSYATYDEAAGAFTPSKDTWLTPAEHENTDFGFLYYYNTEKAAK